MYWLLYEVFIENNLVSIFCKNSDKAFHWQQFWEIHFL